MNKTDDVAVYSYRKYNANYGDGEVLQKFTGTCEAAIHEGRLLAKKLGHSVTMHQPAYGLGGSIILHASDLR